MLGILKSESDLSPGPDLAACEFRGLKILLLSLVQKPRSADEVNEVCCLMLSVAVLHLFYSYVPCINCGYFRSQDPDLQVESQLLNFESLHIEYLVVPYRYNTRGVPKIESRTLS